MRARRSNRRCRRAAVAVLGALALAAPISSAAAATTPFFPSAFPIPPVGGVAGPVLAQPLTGGNAVSGCASNRAEVLGSAAGAEPTSCFTVLSFIGPTLGQVDSQVGPTIIGSAVLAPVTVSAGNVVNSVP
ncbi:MAG TPA: hypothetical protein VH210_13735 [Gaiellaceae bacterium]|jgi:hypothetical protein|nr:hypothetical protein [Gaiellaceae bacterium]